jgi:SAM-dependent methyltransferase
VGIQAKREKCRALVRKYYADVPTRTDLLDQAVLDAARPHHRLLDAGCGDNFPLLHRYGHAVSFAVGVDLVQLSGEKIGRLAAVQGTLGSLPFRDHSFDLIISRSVMEHLEHPLEVFRDFNRVLSSGGTLIFTTPNRFYYSCLIAGLIPFRLKDFYMKRVFGDDAYDHFPVYYRANTVRAFKRLAKEAGFSLLKIEAIRHYPFYLMFSPLLFRLGMLYDWLITSLRMDSLQSNWFVVMKKA